MKRREERVRRVQVMQPILANEALPPRAVVVGQVSEAAGSQQVIAHVEGGVRALRHLGQRHGRLRVNAVALCADAQVEPQRRVEHADDARVCGGGGTQQRRQRVEVRHRASRARRCTAEDEQVLLRAVPGQLGAEATRRNEMVDHCAHHHAPTELHRVAGPLEGLDVAPVRVGRAVPDVHTVRLAQQRIVRRQQPRRLRRQSVAPKGGRAAVPLGIAPIAA